MDIFEIGKSYKFETKKEMFFTGEIIALSDFHVKIQTIRNETILLNKEDIARATEIDGVGRDI